jgi:hypothetical protein
MVTYILRHTLHSKSSAKFQNYCHFISEHVRIYLAMRPSKVAEVVTLLMYEVPGSNLAQNTVFFVVFLIP